MDYTEKRLAEFNETISNVMELYSVDSLKIKDFLIESIEQAVAEERERIVYETKGLMKVSKTEWTALDHLLASLDKPSAE